MSERKRPKVEFEIVVKGEAASRRFPFPGGRDWRGAVSDACRASFGFEPKSVQFLALLDLGNAGDDAWIGARFEVDRARSSPGS